LDFEEDCNCFRKQGVASLYGSVFCELGEHLVDIVLEETLVLDSDDEEECDYGEDDDDKDDVKILTKSKIQTNSMSLVRYLFKTVSLTSLYKMGFKYRHLQVLVVNFINARAFPKVYLKFRPQ
jgi:hypothetical protein